MDDYYFFDEGHFVIVGKRTGRIYRLGETVTVTLVKADVEKKQIDFVLGEVDNLVAIQEQLNNDSDYGDFRRSSGARKSGGSKTKGRRKQSSRKDGSSRSKYDAFKSKAGKGKSSRKKSHKTSKRSGSKKSKGKRKR